MKLLYRLFEKVKYKIKAIEDQRKKDQSQNFLESRVNGRLSKLDSSKRQILTESEVRDVCKFYDRYGLAPTIAFHEFYKSVTGHFDVKFLPETIYYPLIDKYYNDWDKARHMDNKTFYNRLFPNIRQPIVLASRVNGFWYNDMGALSTYEDVMSACINCNGVFVKIANESYGGKGVRFCNDSNSIRQFIDDTDKDIVIQVPIIQHSELSNIFPSSINTIRIISLLKRNGEVKQYSAILRMGVGNSKVDNASSGGITIGITKDGCLKAKAYSVDGKSFDYHPTTGVKFMGIKIPGYKEACELVRTLAPTVPYFRLVSWDIAINRNGNPVLIEANLCDGELDFHQINNGPLFGEDTEEILEEVLRCQK